MELNFLKEEYRKFSEQIEIFKAAIKYDKLKTEVEHIRTLSEMPDFWKEPDKAQKMLKEMSAKNKILTEYLRIENQVRAGLEMIDMISTDFDDGIFKDLSSEYGGLKDEIAKFKIKTAFTDENDFKNAIMTIKPGAGGVEACDWAMMLLRMYTRWCERKGYKVETLEFMSGEEAGIKVATVLIQHEYSYGYLKGEIGIHRLVRISPFDSNARRHTSFASVYIIPEVSDDVKLDMNEKELRVDTFHSSGPGGQSVNTSMSAVRITHVPTGIFATCQVERSQAKNKDLAMKLLRARLFEHFKKLKEEEDSKNLAEKKDISWGHQIRSYVFQPYTMVKDLRSSVETGNINAVMDGDIDDFIEGYLNYVSDKKG